MGECGCSNRPFAREVSAADLGNAEARGYAFGGDGEVWSVWRYVAPHPGAPAVDGPITVSLAAGGKQLVAVKNMYGQAQAASPWASPRAPPEPGV